jgi:hypothetical protein
LPAPVKRIRHVSFCVHSLMPQPRHQVQRHQAARDLHDGQHDRHVGVENQSHAGKKPHAGGEGSRRVRPVIPGDRRLVHSPHRRHPAQQQVGDHTDHEIQGKAGNHESDDVTDTRGLYRGELFAPVPADGQQQIHRQTLIDHVGKLEVHLQDREQEPEVEEQQQRLEQVVQKVLQELMKHGLSLISEVVHCWGVPLSTLSRLAFRILRPRQFAASSRRRSKLMVRVSGN